jgi:MFS family permease
VGARFRGVTAVAAPLPRAFWRLWSAASLSDLGDGLRLAAFPLLAATLTTDPRLVAGLVVAQYVPWLLLGIPAGAVVDRVDVRRLMAGVDVLRTLALTGLVVAVATGTAALPVLYAVALGVGIGETLHDTAVQTAVPRVVPDAQLERANGRLVSSSVVTNEFAGPLVGAALFAVCLVLPFGVHASLVLVAAVLLLGLPALSAEAATPPSAGGVAAGVADGVRWLVRNPPMRTVLLLGMAVVAADSAWFAILVLYTVEVLGLPGPAFGVLLAAGAAGGVAGGLVVDRAVRRLGPARVLLLSALTAAGTQLALGLSAAPVAAALLLGASSLAFAAWNVTSATVRQRLVPGALLGRVVGAFRTCTMSAAAGGAALGGVTAAAFGIRAPFVVGGVALLGVLAVLTRPLLRLVPRTASGADAERRD